jgi:uncharacterized membrane protein
MKLWAGKHWDNLRSSFWFVPALMALSAVALAFLGVAFDEAVAYEWLQAQGWAYAGGAEGASLLLGTIAGSMVTITGVVFSMTLMTLSLASTQLGPRLLRNFMRDRLNQAVLGTFVATFVYCLLVLRTIRRADETLFVPHLSVTTGVLLALVSIGVLIVFIHHVSVSIQADEVVARVGKELIADIDRLFPDELESRPPPADTALTLPEGFENNARAVGADGDGYLQRVDANVLLDLAVKNDLVLRVARLPGRYVVCGQALLMAWPGRRISDEIHRDLIKAFVLGNQRTSAQDIQFPIQQLVEIAVRALSPGVDDPFTAIACVDRLGSGLCRLARRSRRPAAFFDEAGRLRVLADSLSFADIAKTVFAELRPYARSSAVITAHLLDTLAVVASATRDEDSRAALLRAAEQLHADAHAALTNAEDRREVELRYREARLALAVD